MIESIWFNFFILETPIHQPGTPSHCPTPLRTPNHQDSENSSSEDEDRDPNVSYHNPEPTSEIQPDLMEADNIGNTVFSKHWLFTTLMSLIRVSLPGSKFVCIV